MRQAEVAQSTSALLNCNSLYTGLKLDLRSRLRYTVKQIRQQRIVKEEKDSTKADEKIGGGATIYVKSGTYKVSR